MESVKGEKESNVKFILMQEKQQNRSRHLLELRNHES